MTSARKQPKMPALEIYLSEPYQNMRLQLLEKVNHKNLSHVSVLSCPAEKIDSENDFTAPLNQTYRLL